MRKILCQKRAFSRRSIIKRHQRLAWRQAKYSLGGRLPKSGCICRLIAVCIYGFASISIRPDMVKMQAAHTSEYLRAEANNYPALPPQLPFEQPPIWHWQVLVQARLAPSEPAEQVLFTQQPLIQPASVVQVAPFAPLDCAWAAVGAVNEEISGKAIIEANPTLRITSRLDNPSNGVETSDSFSIRFSFFNPSKASQTISSGTGDFNCLPSKKLISLTEVLPSHAW